MGDFRKLVAWQEAKRLSVLSRDAIQALPRTELFALGAQWRRAVYSVALNIAEGAGQASPRQFRRYLEIAKGSLDELQGILELVEALGYLPAAPLRDLRLTRTHCARLVTALGRSVGNASPGNASRGNASSGNAASGNR
jgi:four helix bundle protein